MIALISLGSKHSIGFFSRVAKLTGIGGRIFSKLKEVNPKIVQVEQWREKLLCPQPIRKLFWSVPIKTVPVVVRKCGMTMTMNEPLELCQVSSERRVTCAHSWSSK